MRVSSNGGAPELLVPVVDGEQMRQPQMLPEGQTLLFTLLPAGSTWSNAQTVVQSLDTGERLILFEGLDTRYVASGHLAYVHDGSLFAVPFDADRLVLTGSPTVLVDRIVWSTETGAAMFAVSDAGILAYARGESGSTHHSLGGVQGGGNEEALDSSPGELEPPDAIHFVLNWTSVLQNRE